MSSLWFLFYIFEFRIWYKEQSKEKQKSSLTQDVRGQLHRQGAQFMLLFSKRQSIHDFFFGQKRCTALSSSAIYFPPSISMNMKNRKAINNLLERKQRNAKIKIKGEWKSKRLYFNESKEHHWDILCCFCCFYTSSIMYVCVWMYVQCTILSLYYYYYFSEGEWHFYCLSWNSRALYMHQYDDDDAQTYTNAFTARPYIK